MKKDILNIFLDKNTQIRSYTGFPYNDIIDGKTYELEYNYKLLNNSRTEGSYSIYKSVLPGDTENPEGANVFVLIYSSPYKDIEKVHMLHFDTPGGGSAGKYAKILSEKTLSDRIKIFLQ